MKTDVDLGRDLMRRARGFEHDLENQIIEVLRLEGQRARRGFVHDHADCVDIAALVGVVRATRLLGRQIKRRTHHHAGRGHAHAAFVVGRGLELGNAQNR